LGESLQSALTVPQYGSLTGFALHPKLYAAKYVVSYRALGLAPVSNSVRGRRELKCPTVDG